MSENKMATKADLQRMYNKILPYLGGTAEAGFTPVGTVIAVMGNTAPANYLACNGQVVNIADYPVLADYFEAQFGTKNHFGGDGTTTFGIPDLRGEFLRGTGTNSHKNQGNGANVGVHQNATTIPSIFINGDNNMIGTPNLSSSYEGIQYPDKSLRSGGTKLKGYQVPLTSSWDNDADNLYAPRPTNTSVLYCIATHNIFINPELQYSTQEQVVGTWIDGKPIYQKVLQIPLVNSGTATAYITGENSSTLRILKCITTISDDNHTDGYYFANTYWERDGSTYASGNGSTKISADGQIQIRCTDDWIGYTATCIVQYTKTTDA